MSDGRFSSKPIRTGPPREVAATDYSAEARFLPDDARAFLHANVIQDEINALMDHPLQAIDAGVDCAPLHKSVPASARELGRPVASAVLVQEYLIGLLFLRFWGWIFIAFGLLIVISAIITLIAEMFRPGGGGQALSMLPMVAAIGVGITAAGGWFGIFRGRVIDEMCWFCPRGMIWRTGTHFDWYPWEEAREVYSYLQAARPAIAIRLESNLSVISFSNTAASRRLVDYLESRASAACAPAMLHQIAEGSSARFGRCRLSRTTFRHGDTKIAWRDIAELDAGNRRLRIRRHDGDDLTISLEEVPFPRLFTALVRGIHAYSRAR